MMQGFQRVRSICFIIYECNMIYANCLNMTIARDLSALNQLTNLSTLNFCCKKKILYNSKRQGIDCETFCLQIFLHILKFEYIFDIHRHHNLALHNCLIIMSVATFTQA